MSSYIKGTFSYFSAGPKQDHSEETEPINNEAAQKQGYLKWVASTAYTVGSTTVGAGITGAKWIAGATYNAGAGVVGAAGSAVGTGTAVVGSGAATVVSKVFNSKSKEHRD